MDEIRYFNGPHTGVMFIEEIPKVLHNFEAVAKQVLKENGADHVIFASKKFNKDTTLRCINFYNPPIELSDEEFDERVKGAPDYQIYALHKR